MMKHTLSLVFLLSVIAYGSALRCYVCQDTGSGPCFNENDGDLNDHAHTCSAVTTEMPPSSEETTVSTEVSTDTTTESTESSSEQTEQSSESTDSSSEQTAPTEEPTAPTDETPAPGIPLQVFQIRQRRHVREDAEESYKCYVFFEGTGEERTVERGCISETDAANHCNERDDCRTCTGDLCNAAGSIKGSTAGIFAMVIAVFLLYSN